MTRPKITYLDYAAATPVDISIVKAMRPYFTDVFGNPSSLHHMGARALAALDRARETFSRLLDVDFRNIIFTASATEANNLALRGTVKQFLISNFKFLKGKPKIIVSAVEHDSILETARDMERAGEAEIMMIPVDRRGVVDLKKLESALDLQTVLVSVMYVNNEVGTVQPIAEISNIIRNFRNSKLETRNSKQIQSGISQIPNTSDLGFRVSDLVKKYPLFHVDAAQAFLYYPCAMGALGVDFMTLSSQKIYGPKGAGALVIGARHKELGTSKNKMKAGISIDPKSYLLEPILTGGGQEFGLRAGTENIPAIVGFAAAARRAARERAKNTRHAISARDAFERELMEAISGVERNGPSRDREAPHIRNFSFRGVSSEDLLVLLDREGIAVSTGAACSARALTHSHVLRAMGLPDERIARSIRFSFGRGISVRDAREAATRVANAIHTLTTRYFSRRHSL